MTKGEHRVGEPIQATVTSTAAFTESDNGEPLTVYVASGTPAQFNLIKSRTGELVASQPLGDAEDGHVSSRALATSTRDRRVYIGLASGRVHVVDPDSAELSNVPASPAKPGERLWDACAMEDGRIVFSTYPAARLMTYSPWQRKWKDLGQVDVDAHYALGLSSVGKMIYVGTGTEQPALYQIDADSGRTKRIELPPADSSTSRDFVYDTQVAGDRVFARVASERTIYVYDLVEQKWVHRMTGAIQGLGQAAPGQSVGIYWAGSEGKLHFTDAEDLQSSIRGNGEAFSAIRGSAWQDLAGRGTPDSLVTVNVSGQVLSWDSRDDVISLQPTSGTPAAVRIRSLGIDPEGRILVGGFGTSPYIARTSTDTDQVDHYSLRGQVEAFGTSDATTVAGIYPEASLHEVPADFRQPVESMDQWHVGENQDRPVSILGLGNGRFVVASMPVYGKTGGALSFLDNNRGLERVDEHIAPGRSPLCLAYQEERLYVGTGSAGGYGAKLDPGDGTVIVVETATGRKIRTAVPIRGDATVAALMFDAEGRLWGWTVDSIFEMDPATLGVKHKASYSKARDSNAYARGRQLVDLGDRIAGSARGKIFLIDKKTLRRTDVAEGANVVLSKDGELYYSRGAGLFRWSFGVPGDQTLGED